MTDFAWGVFRSPGRSPRVGVRVGASVIDVAALGLDVAPEVFAAPTLNRFLALGRPTWEAVGEQLAAVVAGGDVPSSPLDDVVPLLPFEPGDYVDFYSSIEHATNLGRMFRPEGEPLLPNWRHLPVGYHGRSSSVVVSGTEIRRPHGQRPPAPDGDAPTHGPTTRLDIELELGFVTGPGNALGEPIPIGEAAEHIFGFGLVNDWSARDIQRWEYVPLGPFLGKSFATSLAAWITPLEALEPYRVANAAQDPAPLDYLRVTEDWALDVDLEIELNGTVVSRTNARTLYWNAAQQLAHATANGCNVRPGDLYASGTISGADPGTYGSFIELTWGGRDPLVLEDGSERTFLEDGDTVVLRGSAGGGALVLGEVAGRIVA